MLRKMGVNLSGCFNRSVAHRLKTLESRLKQNSAKIVETCAETCEYLVAHRIRRTHQIWSLYTRLWVEPLRVLKKGLKIKAFAVLAASFDWNKERIPDQDILRFSAEMSLVDYLKNKKDACLKGGLPPGECKCAVCSATDSEWQTFVEKDGIIVWKREDVNHRGEGLYCYKIYANYDDVSAYDFLEAQVDVDYRLAWDSHAVRLELLESEPSTNSDVIYWETKWPSLFSNRDYVFTRRYRVDKQRNLLFLANHNTTHPARPPQPGKQRVNEYWSYMVIKPKTTFDRPGVEFSLTYFDNPGSNVPSSMMTWVTTSAMPDFLKKTRTAAQGMAKRRGGGPSKLRDGMSKAPPEPGAKLVMKYFKQTMFLF